MNNKEISRKTYQEISSIFYEIKNSLNILTVNKIWSLLYFIEIKNNENYNLTYPPVPLCEAIKNINQTVRDKFYIYIFTNTNQIKNLVTSIFLDKFVLKLPNSAIIIDDDAQNKYIYNYYINSLQNELDRFLNSDQELFLMNNKNSLETLWGQLIISLNDYKTFFQPFDMLSIVTDYSNVQNVLRERNVDRTNFKDPGKQNFSDSISLSSRVNVDKPIEYQNENNKSKTWKQLFEEVYNIVLSSIIQNQRSFFINNSISSQLNYIINEENTGLTTKSLYQTNYTFEGSMNKTTFPLLANQIQIINTIPQVSWKQKTVTYYNEKNIKSFSIINDVDVDKKIITLNSISGISSSYNTLSFPLIGKGFTIEKDFPDAGITFSKPDSGDILLFKDDLQKKQTTSYTSVNTTPSSFYLKNSVFQNNYLNLQKINFQKKLINISKIKDFNIDFPSAGIIFNKSDLNNDDDRKIILTNARLVYLNTIRYPTINDTYFFPESIFNTNLFNQNFNIDQGSSSNRTYEKDFQTLIFNKPSSNTLKLFDFIINQKDSTSLNKTFSFPTSVFNTNLYSNNWITNNPIIKNNFEINFQETTLNTTNPNLFDINIYYKNNNVVNYTYLINNNIFKTNRFTEGSVNSQNATSYWTKYYDDIGPNDGIGSFQDISQNISISANIFGEITIDKSSSCSGNTGFSNVFLLNNFEKNTDINLDFDYYISSDGDSLSQNDLSFKIISYSGNSFSLIDEFNFSDLSLDTNYSIHHTFQSTTATNYRLLINFNEKNNKRNIIKFNNFYVGKKSLGSNEITYSDPNYFINNFYLSNPNIGYISLNSNNQKINFSTDLLNNINYIEFTNINSSLNWMFNDNDLILDEKINYPYIFNTNTNEIIKFSKKRTTSVGGKIYFNFQINKYDLSSNFNVQFKYKILTENFSVNFLTFKIKNSLTDTNSIKEYSLTNNISDTYYNANFSFTSNSTSFNYYLIIEINNQIINDFEIEIKDFYVGKETFAQNTKTYYKIDDFLSDFYLYNQNNTEYLSLQKTSTVNNLIKMKLFTDIFSKNNVINVIFQNVSNGLSWFFTDQSVSLLNTEVNNPFISLQKQIATTTTNFTIIKNNNNSLITSLGGRLHSSFFISKYDVSTVATNTIPESTTTLYLKFKYIILNSFFDPSYITFKIKKTLDDPISILTFRINSNEKDLNIEYSKEELFTTTSISNYFIVELNDQGSVNVNIKIFDVYIGKENFAQNTKSYYKIDDFLNDFYSYNQNNKNLFTLTKTLTNKIRFYSNVFENENVSNFTFSTYNLNLQSIFGNISLSSYSVNPKLSFDFDNSNQLFILNKNNTNLNESYIYMDFTLNNNDFDSNLFLNFNYTNLSSSFNENDISIQILPIKNNLEQTAVFSEKLSTELRALKTFSKPFNIPFVVNNLITRYRVKIKINSTSNNSFIFNFSNFYIGKTSFSQNTITYSNPKDFINDLYLDSNFLNNKLFSLSYKQTTGTSSTGASSISYKIILTSEPFYLGTSHQQIFSNINSSLNFLFGNNLTYTGTDPITYTDTGYEKKYYDSFISLLRRIFTVLNSYALARLFVPEAFDEEDDFFNIGVNIPFSIKSYLRDIMDDAISSLKFENDIKNDPRSNFMKKPPNNNYTKEPTWVQGASLKDAFNTKQLSKFKSTLQQVKSTLKKIKSILEAIKSFIEILEELIELGEDILGALLETVIKEVYKIINNVASTGIYYLPIIDYYATTGNAQKKRIDVYKGSPILKASDSVTSFFEETILNPYGGKNNIDMTNNAMKNLLDLEKTNSSIQSDNLTNDFSKIGITNTSNINQEKDDEGLKNFFLRSYIPYRSTTYDEFINVIISALNDSGDLPAIGLKYDGKNQSFSNAEYVTPRPSDRIRPGAPKWSGNSSSQCVIVAITLPAPEDLALASRGVIKTLLTIIEPFYKIAAMTKENPNSSFKNNNDVEKKQKLEEVKKEIQQLTENLKENSYNKTRYEEAKQEYKKFENQFESKYKAILKKTMKGGEYYEKTVEGGFLTPSEKREVESYNYFYDDFKAAYEDWKDQQTKFKAQIEELINYEIIAKELKEPSSNFGETIENFYITLKQLLYLDDELKDFDTIKKLEDENDLNTDSFFSGIGNRFGEKYKNFTGMSFLDIDDVVQERGGTFSGYRSEYPDFFGISIGSVIPVLFSALKGMLRKLQKFNENESTFSLTEEFELLIAPIEDFIRDVESIIRTIDAIIDFIDALTSISFSYLVIKSGGGIDDITNQLQNAKGFPNEEKRQIIFGAFIGAGTVDPNSGAFDLGGYFKEAAQEFNEDSKDLFRDFNLSNEEMGLSFLNKIFKEPSIQTPTLPTNFGGS